MLQGKAITIYLEQSYIELDKYQTQLEEYKEIIDKYSGESLMDLYVEEVTAGKTNEFVDDIYSFLDYANLEISEAYQYGYIDIDSDYVIEEAVSSDGVGHWLAGYDGDVNEETIILEDGNYSDPFYLFRNN